MHFITKLQVESHPSSATAIKTCQELNGGLAVGADWTMGQVADRATHVCVTRTVIDNASITSTSPPVLQRVAIMEDTDCSASWERIAMPRTNITVCAKFIPVLLAIETQDYVDDIDVSTERWYGDASLGWRTLPTSVHEARPSNASDHIGIFVSVRRPLTPITGVRVLNAVNVADTNFGACESMIGTSWVPLEGQDPYATTVICLTRLRTSSTPVLTNVSIVSTNVGTCTGTSLVLSSSAALCTEFSLLERSRYVVDMWLMPTSGADFSALSKSDFVLSGTSGLLNLFARWAKPYPRSEDYTYLEADTLVDAKPPLLAKADPSGNKLSFKVLQLADLHYTGDAGLKCRDPPTKSTKCTESYMLGFINELLDLEAPDFIVFSGDNVATSAETLQTAATDAFTMAAEQRGIPFAIVIGNHDTDNGFPREQIMELAMKKKHCYAKRGPTNIPGVGNYALDILAPSEGVWGAQHSRVFRMYFLDSHAYRDGYQFPTSSSSYGWIQPSQIDYYRFMASTNTKKTPSVMFFHIPLPEYATTTIAVGQSSEPVYSASVNSHLFPTLLDVGDVKATFVGHDHTNEYCAYRERIHLCYGGGAGFGNAYGNGDFPRRARVIEWQTDDQYTTSITTWTRWYGDIANKYHQQELFPSNLAFHDLLVETSERHESVLWFVLGALGCVIILGLATVAVYIRIKKAKKST